MIFRLDYCVVVCNQNFIFPQYGANPCARWKRKFTHPTPNNSRRLLIPVRNRFNGLGTASSQRMHRNYITAAYMGQNTANRGQSWRNNYIQFTVFE